MNYKKLVLLSALPFLSAPLLLGCSTNKPSESKPLPEEEEEVLDPHREIFVGDIVKEWTSKRNFKTVPFNGPLEDTNIFTEGTIVDTMGSDDSTSLMFEVEGGRDLKGYITNVSAERKFFVDNDVCNGDIVSLYAYIPDDGNLEYLQLELTINGGGSIRSGLLEVNDNTTGKWRELTATFDSKNVLEEIKINYKSSSSGMSRFYLDEITITRGEETDATKSSYVYDGESLWRTYEDYFRVGTCMSSSQNNNQIFRKLTRDNFNSITAENEAKPEQILDQNACKELAKTDPSQVAITVKPFEKIYDFAEANGIGVRHHTFVWYSQTPAWFFHENYDNNGKNVSRDLMLQRMENFIRVTLETINERWPGLVYAIDVANEAIENHTTRNNNNNWYTVVGEDFIYYAFLYASIYKDENQKLYYNDFSYDYDVENCKYAVNTLLKQAIEENLIDGVGIQGHIDSNANMDNLITDAKLIYEKGLECQITELDITTNSTSESDLNKQKDAYKELLVKVLRANAAEETNITGMIVWGLTDDTSWKRGQNPLLFNSSFAKKPAYYGFLEAVNEY